MSFLRTLRQIYSYDVASRPGRFQILNNFLSLAPGLAGQKLRGNIIPRFFKEAGTNIKIARLVDFFGLEELCVGSDVGFALGCLIKGSGGLTIGDHTIMGPGVKIWTVNHLFDSQDIPIKDQGYDLLPVSIGRDVWIGANSFVMPGVTIPDGCVVSAGSIVGVRKFEPSSVIAGNPARVIGRREPASEVQEGADRTALGQTQATE